MEPRPIIMPGSCTTSYRPAGTFHVQCQSPWREKTCTLYQHQSSKEGPLCPNGQSMRAQLDLHFRETTVKRERLANLIFSDSGRVFGAVADAKRTQDKGCRAFKDILISTRSSVDTRGSASISIFAQPNKMMEANGDEVIIASFDADTVGAIAIAVVDIDDDAREDIIVKRTAKNGDVSFRVFINEVKVGMSCRPIAFPL